MHQTLWLWWEFKKGRARKASWRRFCSWNRNPNFKKLKQARSYFSPMGLSVSIRGWQVTEPVGQLQAVGDGDSFPPCGSAISVYIHPPESSHPVHIPATERAREEHALPFKKMTHSSHRLAREWPCSFDSAPLQARLEHVVFDVGSHVPS